MMCVMLIPFRGWAYDSQPFVIYDSGTQTLTFAYGELTADKLMSGYYGQHVSSNGWDLNSCSFYPQQIDFRKSDVRKVEFWMQCYNVAMTDLSGFFEGMSNLAEIDGLENLNTSMANNMSRMFANCISLTSLDLTPGVFNRCFNTNSATDLSGMFSGCSQLRTIYCNDSWAGGHSDVFTGCVNLVGGDGTAYSEERTSSAYAHPNSGGYFTGEATPRSYALFNPTAGTLTFEYGVLTDDTSGDYFDQGITIHYGWGAVGDEEERSAIKKVIFSASCKDYYPTDLSALFWELTELTDIEGIQNINTNNVTDMSSMFSGCTSLTTIDLSQFNTNSVTDMSYMFNNCSSLTSLDLSNFNTGNVTNMFGMFMACTALTSVDISHFDTSKVTDMSQMFRFCESLESIDVSHFNTSNVTDMSGMFYVCSSLTDLDVSNFNTSNVSMMYEMFAGCSGLTSLNLNNFNTSQVTNMEGLFWSCTGITSLDLSNFDTSKVTDMSVMFALCNNLASLDISSFDTGNVTNMSFMFYECNALSNLDLRNFNTSDVTDFHTMFRGCTSLTSLDVSNFDTSNATDLRFMFIGCSNLETIYCNDTWAEGHENMFEGCESIKGGHGTTYSAENISSAYAHPNSGGYFTAKRTTFTTVTIGTSVQYWSSFYTDTRNVRADNSTTVYTATLSSDGKELTLNEIADKIIPCGQAVLMKSTEKEPMFVTASSEGTGDYSTNSLQGTQVDIPTSSIEGTVYTLANEKGEFGYFRYTGATLKGGKAFLVVPGGALARITIAGLGDDATGIERIGTDESQAPCYDLQGRRVSQTQKGVYIINGKKEVK